MDKTELFERTNPAKALAVLIFMDPMLRLLGASDNTFTYAKQYVFSTAVLVFSCICMILFIIYPEKIVSVFIADAITVSQGAAILKGRCFALPFMLIGYQVVNFMTV